MDRTNQSSSSRRFYKWFKRRHKRPLAYHLGEVSGKLLIFFLFFLILPAVILSMAGYFSVWFDVTGFKFLADAVEDDGDEELEDDVDVRSMEMDPCTSTDELR